MYRAKAKSLPHSKGGRSYLPTGSFAALCMRLRLFVACKKSQAGGKQQRCLQGAFSEAQSENLGRAHRKKEELTAKSNSENKNKISQKEGTKRSGVPFQLVSGMDWNTRWPGFLHIQPTRGGSPFPILEYPWQNTRSPPGLSTFVKWLPSVSQPWLLVSSSGGDVGQEAHGEGQGHSGQGRDGEMWANRGSGGVSMHQPVAVKPMSRFGKNGSSDLHSHPIEASWGFKHHQALGFRSLLNSRLV